MNGLDISNHTANDYDDCDIWWNITQNHMLKLQSILELYCMVFPTPNLKQSRDMCQCIY